MKTTSSVLLGLPTFFFVMSFLYNPFDEWWVTSLFLMLSLLSALACLVWAWIIRHRSRPFAWACMAVGIIYFVLLVVVPLVLPAPKTKRAVAEPIGPGESALAGTSSQTLLVANTANGWRCTSSNEHRAQR